ncbi:oligosaccharide MFS transporter [Limosilactobacillus mucosae]|uniref:oligosaccharide MFS transporter n=1 Tax=Limosilactobacillus mucosae TaxID=97478 RepID=UPI00068F4E3A|nr:oligosaccharide MFS transporter [Limosilactobacillus mucosae]MDC2840145.1 oligosaccharide MFS transporter [Limosilactobacillus mucosae]MDC2845533.1 oligosaccharide MFS transporter [Limosilactobacillus mucosae]PWJ43637.1 OHS family lactose permease-like MFS transporter [Limosilactobacillus mucosae]SUQ20763.1 MFS transporter, OHS family, lactose permease [Limosilactobacillus mucosae]
MSDANNNERSGQLKNPFYVSNSLNILLFFAGWGIWWSFFQIWLTTKEGFSGAQVGEIYSFNSAFSLIMNLVYSNIQDRLGIRRNLLVFCAVLQVFLGPFFTFLFVPMLRAHFLMGALIGSCYLTLAYLSASPMFEALTERVSRRFNYQYGSARGWGSFGYALSALIAGFLFTIDPALLFWLGSGIAVVLLILLLCWNPIRNEKDVAKFENPMVKERENSKPASKDFLNIFKIRSLWEIAIFLVFSGTFYTIFDQQMFPQFFTQFFKTQAVGDHMYGILNSVEVFLEAIMMGLVPLLMKKIGVRRTILVGVTFMFIRIGGCGLITNPVGVSIIKLLHAPETAIFCVVMFRYYTLHYDPRVSATINIVTGIAGSFGQILLSTPLGILRDHIGYQPTFLVIAGIVFCAGIYGYFIIRKDDQEVNGEKF